MTRVLMTADAVGGIWQYATDLARALVPHGVEVVIAVLGPEADGADSSPSPVKAEVQSRYVENCSAPSSASSHLGPGLRRGGDVRIIHTNRPLDWMSTEVDVLATARILADLAIEVGADLIHLNSPSLAAHPMPLPTLAVAHGCIGTWWQAAHDEAPPPVYAWLDELIRTGLLAADAIVAPSASYAAAVERHHRLPTTPLVIHNGRHPVEAEPTAVADVFTAGRLWDPVKNIALLDRIAARVAVPFEAAGALVGPHGETIAPRYLLTPGTLADSGIAARLAARPIFVSAARFEPFGLAVLEAAQAGCPLVLSGIDTFRELWTGAALFVPDDDETAYVAAIERVLGDGELRRHLGEAARQRAGRYTPEAMAAATVAVYAGLLGERRQAAA